MIYSRADRAVSPVVGVILMVAVTVILSAVVGAFVFDLGQSTTSSANDDQLGVRTSYADGQATVQVVSGTADELHILVNGESQNTISDPSAGVEASVAANPDDRVSVVSVTDGEEQVVLADAPLSESGAGVPSQGLVGYWSFDNGSGDTAIDSAGDHHGTLVGATWTTNAAVGSHALSFSGSDRVELSGWTGITGTQSRTWAFWVKPSGSGQWIVSYGANNAGEKYEIRVHGENTSRVENSGGQKYGGPKLTDGDWHHVAIVFPDGGSDVQDHRIYVDGQLVTETGGSTQTLDTAASTDVWFGNSHWYSGLDGQLDEVYAYDRALSKSEVRSLYKER